MPSSDLELQKMPIYTVTRIVTHSIKCESNANREYRTPRNSTTKKLAFHNVRKYICLRNAVYELNEDGVRHFSL